jgi:hypothetical protein
MHEGLCVVGVSISLNTTSRTNLARLVQMILDEKRRRRREPSLGNGVEALRRLAKTRA